MFYFLYKIVYTLLVMNIENISNGCFRHKIQLLSTMSTFHSSKFSNFGSSVNKDIFLEILELQKY